MIKFFLSVFLLLSSISLLKAENDQFHFAYFHAPPYTTNNNGEVGGFVIDVMMTVAKETSLDIKFDQFTKDGFYKMLGIGNRANIQVLSKRKSSQKNYIFGHRMMSVALHLHWLSTEKPIKELSSLAGKKILVESGYLYGGVLETLYALQPTPEIISVRSAEQVDKMFLSKRAPYLLKYHGVDLDNPKYSQYAGSESKQLHQLDLYIAVRKTVPNASELLNQLNTALIKIQKKNTIKNILDSYLK